MDMASWPDQVQRYVQTISRHEVLDHSCKLLAASSLPKEISKSTAPRMFCARSFVHLST